MWVHWNNFSYFVLNFLCCLLLGGSFFLPFLKEFLFKKEKNEGVMRIEKQPEFSVKLKFFLIEQGVVRKFRHA